MNGKNDREEVVSTSRKIKAHAAVSSLAPPSPVYLGA